MCGDFVPATAGDSLECSLERRVLERLHLAAVAANEVVVMIAARIDALETRHAVAEVHPLDEPELVEPFEGAINARDADSEPARANPVVDLLRGEAAVLATEVFDDDAASTAASAALRSASV